MTTPSADAARPRQRSNRKRAPGFGTPADVEDEPAEGHDDEGLDPGQSEKAEQLSREDLAAGHGKRRQAGQDAALLLLGQRDGSGNARVHQEEEDQHRLRARAEPRRAPSAPAPAVRTSAVIRSGRARTSFRRAWNAGEERSCRLPAERALPSSSFAPEVSASTSAASVRATVMKIWISAWRSRSWCEPPNGSKRGATRLPTGKAVGESARQGEGDGPSLQGVARRRGEDVDRQILAPQDLGEGSGEEGVVGVDHAARTAFSLCLRAEQPTEEADEGDRHDEHPEKVRPVLQLQAEMPEDDGEERAHGSAPRPQPRAEAPDGDGGKEDSEPPETRRCSGARLGQAAPSKRRLRYP